MLYQLGASTFDVAPLNVHEVSESEAADFVDKPVLGRRPPVEFVGPGTEETTFEGRLLPAQIGGLAEFEDLRRAREAGLAQLLTRGDGENLGWRVITGLRRRSTYLDIRGVGGVIDFEITLRRCDPPSADAMHGALVGLLADSEGGAGT